MPCGSQYKLKLLLSSEEDDYYGDSADFEIKSSSVSTTSSYLVLLKMYMYASDKSDHCRGKNLGESFRSKLRRTYLTRGTHCAMKLAATLLLYPIATLADDTRRVNFTSYRVTPRLITGLVDHDTGDAAGDVYFALYQLTFPLYCLKMPRDSVCHTKVLANTSDNVYRQSIVEADSRFGVYNGCDPQNNGSFICHPYWRDGTCWYDFEDFKTRFSGICDPHQCTCLAASQSAVGKYSCEFNANCVGWRALIYFFDDYFYF